MAVSSPMFVGTLLSAIPTEDGAVFVARVGERATIATAAGNVDVGSVALTIGAIDELAAQVLPTEQLQALRETGTVEFDFTPPDGSGEFSVVAGTTQGDRWLEIRRRPAAAAAVVPLPSISETLVAELLSRTSSRRPKAMTPSGPPAPPEPARVALTPLATEEPAPPVTEESVAPVATDDLAMPTNLEFAANDSGFAQDDLTLPDALLEGSSIPAHAGPGHVDDVTSAKSPA